MSALMLYCAVSNNARHPLYHANCKSIMIIAMNVKEFDNFV